MGRGWCVACLFFVCCLFVFRLLRFVVGGLLFVAAVAAFPRGEALWPVLAC